MKHLLPVVMSALVSASAVTVILSSPNSAQTQANYIATCRGTKNTVRIIKDDKNLIIRAFNHRDNITWLNTLAQGETSQKGSNFFNIRGEQKVNLYIPNTQDFCEITIGNQPTEIGTLITNNMTEASIRGTITYRERIALPSGAIVKIKLLDISRQDAEAIEIASQTIITKGEQVPIPFELFYDPSKIEEKFTYAVRSEIYLNDQLTFTTGQIYPVITRGNPTEVNLVLTKVASNSSPNKLAGTKWLLEDIGGTGVIDNLQSTLEFGENNQIGGNGGCNRYFSSYKLDGTQFTVDVIGSTQKMCGEAVMNQEQKFLRALEKAYNLRLEGPYLLIDVEGYDAPLKFTRL